MVYTSKRVLFSEVGVGVVAGIVNRLGVCKERREEEEERPTTGEKEREEGQSQRLSGVVSSQSVSQLGRRGRGTKPSPAKNQNGPKHPVSQSDSALDLIKTRGSSVGL